MIPRYYPGCSLGQEDREFYPVLLPWHPTIFPRKSFYPMVLNVYHCYANFLETVVFVMFFNQENVTFHL